MASYFMTFGKTPDGPNDGTRITEVVTAFRAQRRLRHPLAKQAAELLDCGQPDTAETVLSPLLEKNPRDAAALNLMAEIAVKRSDYARADTLLAKCLDMFPEFALARFNHAFALHNLNRLPEALEELDQLLDTEPHNFLALDLKSVVLAVMGRHELSMLCRKQLVEDYPADPEMWIKYGSALRSLANYDNCISAYRKATELRPSCGAWWDLADLKTYRFSDAEIAAMREQLAHGAPSRRDRIYLHFALGKALGDRKEFSDSFENYARANALKRSSFEYESDDITKHVSLCTSVFTRDFFQDRQSAGSRAHDPIFIIGMQRAGSTLVESILASHSAIEATAELPDVSLLAERVGTKITPEEGYPAGLAKLELTEFDRYGAAYLESTRFRRTSKRPFFIDKMPYNFLHLGLIHLILPNSKIIDVRRHPVACCFSNFSMHFEVGPLFAYRLNELGRAYVDYVKLTAHFDAVLPGRIHRVFYEDLVADPESEVRRLLDHLQLPFENACLRFHESSRTMSSVSAEQVRRPIFSDGLDHWRNYEPWLGPLKTALGPVLEYYPDIPVFTS